MNFRLFFPARACPWTALGVATRNRPTFPPAETSLELEPFLLVSAQSTSPSARMFNVDGFPWVIDEPIRTEDDVLLGDLGVHSRSGGSRVRSAHVADDVFSWHERRFARYGLFGRTKWGFGDSRSPGLAERDILHFTAGNPDLIDDASVRNGQDGELDARVLAIVYSSADRRFRKWTEVVLHSFVCNYADYPVTRRDKSDISTVKWAALLHELAEDLLRWFSDFAVEKHWHSSDAVYQ